MVCSSPTRGLSAMLYRLLQLLGKVAPGGSDSGLTADTTNCPETATKLPGGGHENCPLTAMRSARHDSVCLAVSRG